MDIKSTRKVNEADALDLSTSNVMVMSFKDWKRWHVECLLLFLIFDVGQMETCCFQQTFQVSNEQVEITSTNYPHHYPNNFDCFCNLVASVDAEVLITFEHFDLEENDFLDAYYGSMSSGIDHVSPDSTCVSNVCAPLRSFEIVLRFRSGNATTGAMKGFSALAKSVPRNYAFPIAVLLILFLLAISVPSCIFVWRNKYHKRITRRQPRNEPQIIPVIYSTDASNVILQPPPAYQVAVEYPVVQEEHEPPPAYDIIHRGDQTNQSSIAHAASECVNTSR